MKQAIAGLLFLALSLFWGTGAFAMEGDQACANVGSPRPKPRTDKELGSDWVAPLSSDISKLPTLDKECTILTLTSKGINTGNRETLVAILGELPNLRELHLAENEIDAYCAIRLASPLREHPSLRLLNLAGNKLGDEGIERLRFPYWLSFLDLRENAIGSEGAAALAAKFEEAAGFSVLRLDRNPLGVEGIQALLAKSSRVQNLGLGETALGDEGMRCLVERIDRLGTDRLGRSGLCGLYLGRNGITEGVSALLDRVPSLQILDLGGNPLTPEELRRLSESLCSLSELRELRLDNIPLGDEGMQIIAPNLPKTLEVLGLNKVDIGDDGGTALAKALLACKSLRVLELGYNSLERKSLEALHSVLSGLPKLERVLLTNTPVPLRQIFLVLSRRIKIEF